MLPPTPGPAAGWYADPELQGGERYWDGAQWSEQRRPVQVVPVVFAAPVEPQATNGFAIAALVCGIVGVVFGILPWTFWVAWVLGVLAIVFGAIGRRRADREPVVGKQSMATAGLILGIVAIVFGIIGLIVLLSFLDGVGSLFDDLESCVSNPDQIFCD